MRNGRCGANRGCQGQNRAQGMGRGQNAGVRRGQGMGQGSCQRVGRGQGMGRGQAFANRGVVSLEGENR